MLIPIVLFFIAMLIVVANLYFKNQSRRMWHETARIALEKGQPVPISPAAMEEIAPKKPDRNSGRKDIKTGLILIAIAAGLYFERDGLNLPAAGIFIPGFIGVAMLLNALITYLLDRNNSEKPTSPHPPQA